LPKFQRGFFEKKTLQETEEIEPSFKGLKKGSSRFKFPWAITKTVVSFKGCFFAQEEGTCFFAKDPFALALIRCI
jgi:hypothetical protein